MVCFSAAKGKMSKKKKFWIIFTSVLLVIILAVGITVGVIVGNLKKAQKANVYAENPHGFAQLGVRPNREGIIDVGNLNNMSAEEMRKTAVFLYDTATEMFKNNDCVIYDNQVATMNVGPIDNVINVDSVTIKNDTEYFRIDYRLKNVTPILTMLGEGMEKTLNNGLNIILTERMYASSDMEKMIYQQVKTSAINEETGVPYAVWNDPKNYPVTVQERDIPAFNSSQEGVYSLTAHTIKESTVTSAEVKYHKAEGYYTVTMSLDTTNEETSENALANIREGAMDPDAAFDTLDIEFTVWDNGYFRSYQMTEIWSAKALKLIAFGSDFRYNMYFSYAEEDCNLHEYKDYVDMMLNR